MKSSSSPRMTLALSVALLLVSLTISAVAAPLSLPRANNGRSLLNSSTPAWATGKNFKGPADPSTIVGFRVYLGWTNPSQVETLAQAVSDPRSTLYGQYLTSQQFRQQFAPSQSQVGQVQSWLRSQDFQVEYTPWNNHYVSAEGSIAQAETAFGTSFGLYSVSGLTLRSPSSDLSVPSPLAGIVSGVLGLDDSMQLVHTDHTVGDAPPPPAFVSAQPCSSYWAEKLATGFTNPYGSNPLPYAPCGYTPQQIKGAYGISGYDGAGQTVAIIDAYAAPTIVQDVNQWSINRGIPSLTPSQLVQVVAPGTYNHPEKGNYQDPQGWYGEETLDIEAVHGMAPAAKIVYVGAPNNYLSETGWGTTTSSWTGTTWSPTPPGSWLYGSGGGVSRIFPGPFYQAGVVPNSVFKAQGHSGRAVPDISAVGDPNTGLLIGETQTFPDGTVKYSEYRIGGTSLSSPLIAGIMALADQAAGHPHGFANPLFYSLAGSSAFGDITQPSSTVAVVRANYVNGVDASAGTVYRLRTMDQTLSLDTTRGYDDVTGLGTPTSSFLSSL